MKLNVATFNIQHGKDFPHYLETKKEKINLQLMADTIRAMKVDLCGLNEVYGQSEAYGDQIDRLKEELGWHGVFAKAIEIPRGTYGNGLVSRYPIKSVKTVPIQTSFKERPLGKWFEDRVLLIAVLDVEGTEVTVMVCHFGLNALEADRATETVLREGEKISTPMIFMGDLNLTPDDERIRRIAAAFTDTAEDSEHQQTFPSDKPNIKIDYIFAKNCKVLSSQVPAAVASDHRPFRAELEI